MGFSGRKLAKALFTFVFPITRLFTEAWNGSFWTFANIPWVIINNLWPFALLVFFMFLLSFCHSIFLFVFLLFPRMNITNLWPPLLLDPTVAACRRNRLATAGNYSSKRRHPSIKNCLTGEWEAGVDPCPDLLVLFAQTREMIDMPGGCYLGEGDWWGRQWRSAKDCWKNFPLRGRCKIKKKK